MEASVRTQQLAASGARAFAPDTAGITNVFAGLHDDRVPDDIPTPSFRSLFQSTSQRGPVAPVVGALWGGGEQPGLTQPAAASAPRDGKTMAPSETNLFGLFPNNRPPLRGLFDVKS